MSGPSAEPAPPVVVTGPGGFIGRCVCNGTLPTLPLTVRAGDPVFDLMQTTLRGKAAAAVVHLAARAHATDAHEPNTLALYRRDNVELTLAVARAALDCGIHRFVFISSIGVFGQDSGAAAFTPDTPPRPQSAYARAKLEAEEALIGLAESRALELVIVRPPLVYGAGAPGNLARLARAIEKGLPLPLGAIRNRRSLVNVEDLADLLCLAAHHPDAPGRVFLPADEVPVSTPELVRAMAAALARPARLLPIPPALLRAGGRLAGRAQLIEQLVGNLEVDASAAIRILGWQPRRGLASGLKAFAAYRRPYPIARINSAYGG